MTKQELRNRMEKLGNKLLDGANRLDIHETISIFFIVDRESDILCSSVNELSNGLEGTE